MATLASVLDSVLRVGVGEMRLAVAFPNVAAFAAHVRQSRSVPGFPFASVARTATGPQLFVDRTMLPTAKLASLDAGAVWQAAYSGPVPHGYRAILIPSDPLARFQVLSIVAVLIPLLPTVERKVREAVLGPPGGLNVAHDFADGSVRFSPLR